MQSGISASKELYLDFNTLLGSDTHFGLLVTIKSEQLTPLTFLTPSSPASSSTFAQNLETLLAPHLQPKEALYILLRRFDTAPYLTAVSYVPDAAPVRQKMLFASTRLTLTRELGTEHFRETILATAAEELSARGFEKHDAHEKLEAPLTEEERSLGEVKRAEAEAGSGTGTREIHLSKNLAMPVDEAAVQALKDLGTEGGQRNLVMLKINPDTEVIELAPEDGSAPSSIPELVKTISPSEPRFAFYRFDHSYGGNTSSPVLFIYTCPAAPGIKAKGIKSRMMYPLMKRAVRAIGEGEAGLKVERTFEVEDPSEITEDAVLGELHPKVTVRQGFSRPKRPGR
ncbi:putative actin binding protein [Coniochaeta ligniaria NRRL 30616]|uniref:Twinfilin n=1 Tax=Coniochaeta ligniaria NRRL 30616 TaxID=1408157 RepID=A0A1J7IZK1_9PEZI|nr:putative actin binding protein [Coniochaeta ligniaria NRRL 30616]